MVAIAADAASGPRMIVDEAGLATGAASAADMAGSVNGPFDGGIISAFGDPRLDEASRILPFPVCGIGAASFAEAALGGRRFAVGPPRRIWSRPSPAGSRLQACPRGFSEPG